MSKYYFCKHCGNVVTKLEDKGVPVLCCGEKMTEILPNMTDAAQEKHVPIVSVKGNIVSVSVGSVTHPMSAEHSIRFIALETTNGLAVKWLAPDAAPAADFALTDGEEVVRVLAWCNLHGMWQA